MKNCTETKRTDGNFETRIEASRVITEEAKAKSIAGLGKMFSDPNYAKSVNFQPDSPVFSGLFIFSATEEGRHFWGQIACALGETIFC